MPTIKITIPMKGRINHTPQKGGKVTMTTENGETQTGTIINYSEDFTDRKTGVGSQIITIETE